MKFMDWFRKRHAEKTSSKEEKTITSPESTYEAYYPRYYNAEFYYNMYGNMPDCAMMMEDYDYYM